MGKLLLNVKKNAHVLNAAEENLYQEGEYAAISEKKIQEKKYGIESPMESVTTRNVDAIGVSCRISWFLISITKNRQLQIH